MDETERITEAWKAGQAQLPEGWTIDGLRCASTSLAEQDRSDDWIARAIGPADAVRELRASDPVAALLGLPVEVRRTILSPR